MKATASKKSGGREVVTVALLVVAALVFRFLLSSAPRVIWGDEPFYLWLGRNWVTGQGYTFTGYSDVHHTPLYPFMTGLLYLLTGDMALSSRIWYIICGALLALPIYGIAREIYDRRAGYIAAALLVIYPALSAAVLYWGTLTEPPYYLLVYSGLYMALLALRRKSLPWTYAAAGVFFGLAYLTRPEAIAYLIAIGVLLAFVRLLERDLFKGRTLLGLTLFVLGFALFFAPYAYYVHEHTGSWMISEKAGVTFVTGLGLSRGDTAAFDKATWGLDSTGLEVFFFSPESYNVSMLDYILDQPHEFARLVYENTVKFANSLFSWRLFPYYLTPLIALALWRSPWSKERTKAELLLWASLTPSLTFVLFFVQDRYIATLLPTLLIWLAVGVRDMGDWLSGTIQNLLGEKLTTAWWNAIAILPLIPVLVLCGLLVPRALAETSRGSFRPAHRTVGLILKEGGLSSETVVMCRYPAIAFHAGTRWVPTPNAEYEEVLRYARHKGADYWIVDERETVKLRPQFASLIHGTPPVELELVMRLKDEGETLVVYRFRKQPQAMPIHPGLVGRIANPTYKTAQAEGSG